MNTVDRLRTLLDSFYSGNASGEDVSEIRQLFASLPELPEDLVADKEVFDALSDPRLDNVPVPQGVEKLISATIADLDTREQHKRTVSFLWVKVTGIAAVVAVLLAIGVHFMHRGELATSETSTLVAGVDTVPDQEKIIHVEESTAETIRGPEPVVFSNTKTAAVKITSVRTKVASDVKVVTDQEEAEEYILKAMSLLSENMSRAEQTIEEPAKAINQMNQTMNNILK